MSSVLSDIPDADVLLALEPEELAPIVLRTAMEGQQLHLQSITYRIFERHDPVMQARFSSSKRDPIELAWISTPRY